MLDTSRKPTYDVEKMLDDMALKGWLPADLARHAKVADMTVYRFLARKGQTAKTATKLAAALGYSVRRYLISAKRESTVNPQPTEAPDVPSPIGDRRAADRERRLGGRRRANRIKHPDRRKGPR